MSEPTELEKLDTLHKAMREQIERDFAKTKHLVEALMMISEGTGPAAATARRAVEAWLEP